MKLNRKELEKAIKMATSKHWNDGLPVIPAKLNLVVNSLLAQSTGKTNVEEFFSLIEASKNKGIRRILRNDKITTAALAFAIRAAIFHQ